MLEIFLKENEKNILWQNLSSNSQNIEEQDDDPEIRQSAEYKTFEALFNLMNDPNKIRLKTKEKILRPFYRLFEQFTLKNQARKKIIQKLIQQESILTNLDDIESLLNDWLV